MKAPKILCSIAALAFSLTASKAVETDPVGFVSVTVPANSDTPIGLPLSRAAVMQTNVTQVVGNAITLGTTLAANQLVYTAVTQPNRYYISVKNTASPSSTAKGRWFEVLSNTTNAVTVDQGSATQTAQAQGLAVGDTIEVIPFWTLNTLFPNGQGLTVTTDIDVPQDLVLQLPQNTPGVNLTASKAALYSTDTVNLATAGWYDASSFVAIGDDAIVPDSYIVIRNKGAAQSTTVVGTVPMSAKSSSIVSRSAGRQDNFVVNPFPVAISLPGTSLIESGAFTATNDIDNPKDLLLVYAGTEVGFNSTPSRAFVYSTDTVNLAAPGWYDANTFDGPYGVNDKLIPSGAGMIVRKATGANAELAWSAPQPY